MANTYTQLYIHLVFAVKGRQNQISNVWKEELFKYVTGIISNKKNKLIAINGVSDHIHLLIGLNPQTALSSLVRDIKANSSRFINERNFLTGKFFWQEGYGAFSCSHSQLDSVINYIKNQEKHHIKKSFQEEYIEFLRKYEIPYNEEYLFSF